jgi:hypothetical protein
VDWDIEDEYFVPDSADQAVQEVLGSLSAPFPWAVLQLSKSVSKKE